MLSLSVVGKSGTVENRSCSVDDLIIAGWAGRSREAIEAHIRELEAIGIKPPSSVPLFYRAAADLLTQAPQIQVLGPDSSGEVETVLIQDGRDLLVAVGSDHTDRKVEGYSIAVSKQMCAKPVSSQAWRYSDVAEHWDRLVLRSWAMIEGKRMIYQQGTLDGLLSPTVLFSRFAGADRLPDGTVMYGGTLSVEGGIRPMTRFEIALEDPVLSRSLNCAYDVVTLPVVS